MTISWPFSRQQVLDANGRPYLDLRANFFASGTTNPLTVYSDPGRTTARTQPVLADGNGRFPRVYLPDGQYREQVLGPGGAELWFDDGLGEPVVTDPTDPTDPTTPPDANSYARTGDVKWRMDASIQPGWVRLNRGTIGNASSGASERSNADAAALFIYLWTTFPDSLAPVVGGRGLSAASDFAAGKSIALPSMQGRLAAGLDDMGASPAQRLQTIANLDIAEGSTRAQASNTANLALGMSIIAPGLSAGTRIADLDGATVTLSQPAGAGSTGTVQARFSVLDDAQSPGQDGGSALVTLQAKQVPKVTPSGSISPIPAHRHPLVYQRLSVYGGGGASGAVNSIGNEAAQHDDAVTSEAGGATPTFTGTPFGGDQAHSNLPPMRLGTFFMRL
ncbi:hypothetical protein [Methylobacterium aquaticum]|uniref:Uncharacterized protein n=1 Tax=Methylobacterium aquaticum TaxID=270351 RepID=A0A0C6FFZ4_9HYPH|nr:hypothetical protein [Methylobacterium aquaticum]BAQ43964.1 hypothetical protein Maq22A_c02420 [Methylobacterium aquaticum]